MPWTQSLVQGGGPRQDHPTYTRTTITSGRFNENDPNLPPYLEPDLSSHHWMPILSHFLVLRNRVCPPFQLKKWPK